MAGGESGPADPEGDREADGPEAGLTGVTERAPGGAAGVARVVGGGPASASTISISL